ncbi:MAG: DUF4202 domain-containing protein [Gammaproteobacteria bacterium]|nr:DUF4202 domain-containing protein [Gammaproteobacteria bacterium]
MTKLIKTLAAIDTLHHGDPNQQLINGVATADEFIYAQQMTTWLNKLTPSPSELAQIAVRSQHLCRWELPRSQFEMNRAGYLKWRVAQGKYHGEKASQVMRAHGYEPQSCDEIIDIVRKKNIKSNNDTQLMEDAACLVFLEFQFKDFVEGIASDEKVIRIVQKTWVKMSEQAHQFALQLSYSDQELTLIKQALA